MPISYPIRIPVATGIVFSASVNLATSNTVTYPSGSNPGDVLIMQVSSFRSVAGAYTIGPTQLTGGGTWATIQSNDNTASGAVWHGYYWCRRGAETSVIITPSVSTSMRTIGATIVAYYGGTVDQVTPVGDSDHTYASASSSSGVASPAVTTTRVRSEILNFGAEWLGSLGTLTATWSGGATELADNSFQVDPAGTADDRTIAHSVGSLQQQAIGNSGTYTMTPNVAAQHRMSAAIVINGVDRRLSDVRAQQGLWRPNHY